MIIVNGKKHEWDKPITVKELLEIKQYVYPKLVVKINGKFIPKNEYNNTLIYDNDEIQVIHLLAGG